MCWIQYDTILQLPFHTSARFLRDLPFKNLHFLTIPRFPCPQGLSSRWSPHNGRHELTTKMAD